MNRTSAVLAFLLMSALSGSLAAQATKLVIVTQPTTVRANQTFTIVVEGQDAGDVLDTGYTSQVTLSIASGPGTLGGTFQVNAVAGVATFSNLTLNTIGDVTIDADDGALTPDTSTAIAITADRLVITTQPTTTTAGAAIASIVVAARDGLGNTDTNFTGSITVTKTNGTGTLGGTTSVGATAGVATFSNLSINLIGSDKELTFASAPLTSAVSNQFTINPAADDEVRFVQEPSNAQAGVAISPAITVEIIDQFGNRTTSTAQIGLAIGVNPGGSILTGGGLTAAVAGLATFAGVSLNNAGTGYTLIASSTGLTSDTSATFNITAAPTPTISIVGSLTAFSTTGVGVPSTEQSYNVSGTNLTGNISIVPPTNFQISLSGGGGFTPTNPITLTQAGGTVASTQIFVRYNPTTGGSHNGNIAHSSSGATTQNQAVSGSIAAPAAGSLSASPSNPGSQSASPGSSRTGLVFRVTETGGSSPFTVTGVSVTIATTNNAGGAAINRISSVSLRRGGTTLGTVTNPSAGFVVVGNNVTVNYTGLSSAVSAGLSADFSIIITFTGASVPAPAPIYQASIQTSGVNGGVSVTGTAATGGLITLSENAPGDPFAEEDDDSSCDLSTGGGPAWPLVLAISMLAVAALRRRRQAS